VGVFNKLVFPKVGIQQGQLAKAKIIKELQIKIPILS